MTHAYILGHPVVHRKDTLDVKRDRAENGDRSPTPGLTDRFEASSGW